MREAEPQRTELEDEALVAQIASGDASAMTMLYDRYADLVYSFLLRIIGDPTMAADRLQATFLRVWQLAPQLGGGGIAVDGRILEIARELGVAEARNSRAAGSKGEDHTDGARTQALRMLPTVRAAGDSTPWMGAQLRIRDALHRLPQDQRRTVELCYFHGYSLAEIAELQGEPRAIIEERVRMGFHDLAQTLARTAPPAES